MHAPSITEGEGSRIQSKYSEPVLGSWRSSVDSVLVYCKVKTLWWSKRKEKLTWPSWFNAYVEHKREHEMAKTSSQHVASVGTGQCFLTKTFRCCEITCFASGFWFSLGQWDRPFWWILMYKIFSMMNLIRNNTRKMIFILLDLNRVKPTRLHRAEAEDLLI